MNIPATLNPGLTKCQFLFQTCLKFINQVIFLNPYNEKKELSYFRCAKQNQRKLKLLNKVKTNGLSTNNAVYIILLNMLFVILYNNSKYI